MEGLHLLEPSDLYNMLQQATVHSNLSDLNYLLLIDARKKGEYNESHVVTAKKAPLNEDGDFVVALDAELECKQHIVVYDSNTSSLKEESPAIQCGKVLWNNGSRNQVMLLKGGYETFSALYPFLRTQKIIFMAKELDEIKPYPAEIVHGVLYLGNWRQGNAAYIQKDLKIKGHINCCVESESFFSEPGAHLLHIQMNDDNEADLYSKFETACDFIECHKENGQAVLVFSNLGISRAATVAIAYLMKSRKTTLKEAYDLVKKYCNTLRPNRGFISQLSKWEEDVLGQRTTNIADPYY
ncbi:hypothetical protein ScPMuIL_006839 [Solemya velum]